MRTMIVALALCLAPCAPHANPAPSPTTMACDGDPTAPLHCSAAGGETVCDTQPELCTK